MDVVSGKNAVQDAMLDAALEGCDIIAKMEEDCIEAVCIAAVEKVIVELKETQALIIVPKTEYAAQVATFCSNLSQEMTVKVLDAEANTAQILVATPDKASTILDKKKANVKKCFFIALLGAEKLLPNNAVNQLVSIMPKSRQVLVIASSFTQQVAEFASQWISKTMEFNLDDLDSKEELKAQVYYLKAMSRKQLERLAMLRRHCVYVFFSKNGKLIYVGQETMGGQPRIREHLARATGRTSEGHKPFHSKLEKELKQDGVYAISAFGDLDEIDANEIETLLIRKVKEDPKNAGNVNEGRSSRRLEQLKPNEAKEETDELYAKVLQVFKRFSTDDLITWENAEQVMKSKDLQYERPQGICSVCHQERSLLAGKCATCRTFNKVEDCVRCKRKRNVNNNGYCKNCATGLSKNPKNTAFDPSKAREDAVRDNETQRALAYSMYKKELNAAASADLICQLMKKSDAANGKTVNNWHQKFKADKFVLNDFLKVKKKEFDGLSSDTLKMLIHYEIYLSDSAKQAKKRINSIFGEDTVSLELVKEKYEVVRKAAAIQAKKRKLQSNAGDVTSKKSKS